MPNNLTPEYTVSTLHFVHGGDHHVSPSLMSVEKPVAAKTCSPGSRTTAVSPPTRPVAVRATALVTLAISKTNTQVRG